MASPAVKTNPLDRIDSVAEGDARGVAAAPALASPQNVVLPRSLTEPTPGGGKTVHELQQLIEQALTLLARESEEFPDASAQPKVPALGAAAGSEVRSGSSRTSRVLKTLSGLAVVFLVGIVPLEHIFTTSSTEAFVNAPLYSLRAPASGTLVSTQMTVGALVARNQELAVVQSSDAARISHRVVAPNAGKIWEVLVAPGDAVAAGQEIVKVVACSAASVTAAVSETVYDKIAPGMQARFKFYGSELAYDGQVANLLGHSASTGDLALSPASLAGDSYRVIVSVPDLGAIPNCVVGRRGEVIFNPPSR